MSDPREVTCIRRRVGADAAVAPVAGIGGTEAGKSWYLPEADAISAIEGDSASFIVRKGLHAPGVTVAVTAGRKYLKTATDADTPELLLRLPDCP